MKAANQYDPIQGEDLERLSNQQLIEQFAVASKKLGSAVLDSDNRRANRVSRQIIAIRDVLGRRGRAAMLELLPLLESKDRFVSYYAATQLIGIIPSKARAVVEWNAKFGFDAIAGDARMTLIELDRSIRGKSNNEKL